MLFTDTSTALPRDFYFFTLTQSLTISTIHLLYTVKEKVGKPGRKPYPIPMVEEIHTETSRPDRKPYPFPYGLRNPYRNLKHENSQELSRLRTLKIMPGNLNKIVRS